MTPNAPRGTRARAASLLLPALLLVATAAATARAQPAQGVSGLERDKWREALNSIKYDVKDNYYDPAFRGKDLDAHFKAAEEKLKQAQSLGQIFGVIAQALLDFDDSHLYFVPPGRTASYDYGWLMQMVGERCFVTAVKPGSDAEAKGLRPGDEVVTLDGFRPSRANFWKLGYLYYSLRPRPGVRLVVQSPVGAERQVDVLTRVTQGQRVVDLFGQNINVFRQEAEDDERERRESSRTAAVAEDLLVWKFAAFNLTDAEVDEALAKARKYQSLVIDLRGNGGGAEKTMLRLIGNVFDRDVKVGDIKRRKELKPLVAKTRGGDNVFKGRLAVLLDSGSGSAAEVFARVVQLEKRGVVVGDASAGAVMRSRFHQHQTGSEIYSVYGASVTDADVLMADGKSLEHVGVTPDHPLLPTAADLAAGRDPVLAGAAALFGVKLDPEKAGALFPVRWRK
ncbi:MAG TPA: S41 family peptidase [Pyrinomonadaceae bacterium]|jgi:carboxyl-terminal processing protease